MMGRPQRTLNVFDSIHRRAIPLINKLVYSIKIPILTNRCAVGDLCVGIMENPGLKVKE